MADTAKVDGYELLMRELPRVAKVVNAFSGESVQKEAFDRLISALLHGQPTPSSGSVSPSAHGRAGIPAKSVKRMRKGSDGSARGRVAALADGGFFSQPRSVAAVTQALKTAGHHYPSRKISMALLTLTRAKQLRRQGRPGGYEYVNA